MIRAKVRNLTGLEFEELCDLAQKAASGDLLDFVHWINDTAKRNGWSREKIISILRWMPAEEGQE